ncbi:hypothetical protein GCM10018953_59030 [Streptosporangium nondiastaticum]|uniref:hypothetical protein n=1 Tax=Streptosporangium nondiastaticum TaxID=35764 RepID=UPI0031F8A202
MDDFFRERILDTGRLPLFCFFVALIVAFVLTRINVRLIRAKIGWFGDVSVGDMHIHHVVFGVVLTLLGGVAGLVVSGISQGWYAVTAAVFGVGAALILDEFALILHLRDVYWEEEGRASVDAVFTAIAITGLLLTGLRPLGWEDSDGTPRGAWLTAGAIVANLVLAVVTLLKGKIWTGLAGLFLPPLLIVGAVRLARPGSPWAHWFMAPGSRRPRPRKMARGGAPGEALAAPGHPREDRLPGVRLRPARPALHPPPGQAPGPPGARRGPGPPRAHRGPGVSRP